MTERRSQSRSPSRLGLLLTDSDVIVDLSRCPRSSRLTPRTSTSTSVSNSRTGSASNSASNSRSTSPAPLEIESQLTQIREQMARKASNSNVPSPVARTRSLGLPVSSQTPRLPTSITYAPVNTANGSAVSSVLPQTQVTSSSQQPQSAPATSAPVSARRAFDLDLGLCNHKVIS